jgi:hypothetical protein
MDGRNPDTEVNKSKWILFIAAGIIILFGLYVFIIWASNTNSIKVAIDTAQVNGMKEGETLHIFPMPDSSQLQMILPAGWNSRMRQPSDNVPPTIGLQPVSGAAFKATIIVKMPAWKGISPPTDDQVRELVLNTIASVQSQVAEKTIDISEFKGTAGAGYYFNATNAAPQPGDLKHLTQGAVRVGELILNFTIITDDGQEAVVQQGIGVLATTTHN